MKGQYLSEASKQMTELLEYMCSRSLRLCARHRERTPTLLPPHFGFAGRITTFVSMILEDLRPARVLIDHSDVDTPNAICEFTES